MSDTPVGSSGRLPDVLAVAKPVVLAVVLTVLAWPIADVAAKATLDASWQTALHMAAWADLRQGVDFLWTYGPLGFLGFPHPYVGGTSTLALIASFAIYVALIGTMLVEARRILPLPAALLVTLLAARIFVFLPPFEASQALAFIWCVEALAGRIAWPPSAIAAVAGSLAGAATLGKVNVGIFVVVMGAVTVISIARPWWKGLPVYLATAAATGLGLWLLLGQHLGDLAAYASGVFQIISGYNDAMGADPQPTRTWTYLALAATAGVVVWSGWRTSLRWPRRERIGLAVLGLVFGFAMWKTAVVREHMTFVFATAVVSMFPLTLHIERRTWLVSVLGIGIAFAGSSMITPETYVDVVGSTRSIYNEAKDAFVPARAAKAAEQTRARLRGVYRLEPPILAALGTHTVHIDPYLASVAAAYPELHWSPLPVFQSYGAYTTALDDLDAERLRSAAAPETILRSYGSAPPTDRQRIWIGRPVRDGERFPFTVDGRFRWFEAPATTLEIFCRYAETAVTDRWQVLARTAGSCGPPEPLGTVTARPGDVVNVPVETRPDRFVTVRISGMEPSLLGRLRSALSRGPDWYVWVDDTRYRLIQATAKDGLLLAVPPSADGTGPFAFGAPIRTLKVVLGLDEKGSGATLTYEFSSVPRRP